MKITIVHKSCRHLRRLGRERLEKLHTLASSLRMSVSEDTVTSGKGSILDSSCSNPPGGECAMPVCEVDEQDTFNDSLLEQLFSMEDSLLGIGPSISCSSPLERTNLRQEAHDNSTDSQCQQHRLTGHREADFVDSDSDDIFWTQVADKMDLHTPRREESTKSTLNVVQKIVAANVAGCNELTESDVMQDRHRHSVRHCRKYSRAQMRGQ